ncbi:MAG TPA: response regulator [Vicinamibacterales bacterium]|nr:response regulator [Vicinamibacterales bacterium]
MNAQVALGKLRHSLFQPPDTPRRILVVDDHDAVRRLVARLLTRAGYEVESACDGEDAIETFRTSKFDLVVSDVRMSGMSGPRLIEQLRRFDADVKVLYLTGYADQLFVERAPLWEHESFLDKPFSTPGLLQSVSLALFGRIQKTT